MSTVRSVLAAVLLAAGAVTLVGCGHQQAGPAAPTAGQAPQELQGVQTMLDDIDREIAGDSQ